MYYKFFTISLGILLSFVPDFFLAEGFLNDTQQLVLRVLILMIFLWLTEVIPSSITALIPIIVTPFISQIELKDVLTSYSSSVVFLILGGFIIALGFEKSKDGFFCTFRYAIRATPIRTTANALINQVLVLSI